MDVKISKYESLKIKPNEWKKCSLVDALVFQRGHDLPRNKMIPGQYPVAGSKGIIGYHNKYTTKGPSIAIGRSGNIGMPVLYKTDFWAHNTSLYVREFKNTDPLFMFYKLKTIDFSNFNAGSAVPTLNRNHIHTIPINLPPIFEQKAIASVLSSLDDKIELLHRQNQTLEALAETIFRQWFIEEADPNWEKVKLGDMINIVDNRGKTPPFTDIRTDYPIIEVNALTGNNRFVNYGAVRKYVTTEVYGYWFRSGHPIKHDTLLSTVGSIGEIAMFLINRGCIAQNVVALRAIKTSPFYLYECLKYMQNDIKEYDIGSVQPSIKVTHLVKMDFIQPDIKILEKFDIIAKHVTEKIVINNKQIYILETLRDTLLPKLMSGEVRVAYDKDEVEKVI